MTLNGLDPQNTLVRPDVVREDPRMRAYLIAAPLWQRTLFSALAWYGCVSLSLIIYDPHSARVTLIVTAVSTAVWTLFAWRAERRAETERSAFLGGITGERLRVLARAAASGTPPDDPMLRPAAVALARYWLDKSIRERTATLIVQPVALLFLVVMTVFTSLWYAFFAAVFAWALVRTVLSVPMQRRRIARLDEACAVSARSS